MSTFDFDFRLSDELAPPASMADAHAEWHRNSGSPIGLTSCPWDACDPMAAYADADGEPMDAPERASFDGPESPTFPEYDDDPPF